MNKKTIEFYSNFFDLNTFCYEQTEPLGVPVYAVGFSLSVPEHFFLSLKKEL